MANALVPSLVGSDYILQDVLRCFLCDHLFEDGEESWLMCEAKISQDGRIENALSSILTSILGTEFDEVEAQSGLLCESCKTLLLDYGNLEQRLNQLRFNILNTFNQTAQRNQLTLIPIEINGVLQDAVATEAEISAMDSLDLVEEDSVLTTSEFNFETTPTSVEEIFDGGIVSSEQDPSKYAFAVTNEQQQSDQHQSKRTDMEQNLIVVRATGDDDDDEIVQFDGHDDIPYNDIIESACSDGISMDGQSELSHNQATESGSNQTSLLASLIITENDEKKAVRPPRVSQTKRMRPTAKTSYSRVDDMYLCLLCKGETQPIKLDVKAFALHMRILHNNRFYACDLCSSGFVRREDLNDHIDDAHSATEGAMFICEYCHRSFNNYRLCQVHRRSHSIFVKKFECDQCQKKFASKNLLEEHMNMHTGERPHQCTLCSKNFASKYTLQGHMKIHSARDRPYKCNLCDKAFLTHQNLVQHRKLHTAERRFECDVCQKKFTAQHYLTLHQVTHTGQRPFACRSCGKKFARRAEVKDHERTHTGERPFQCDVCLLRFAQRSNLQSHKKSTHLNEKLHNCDHCGRSFKRRRLLDYHIQSAHTGERPHKCGICGSGFVYPEHYKKHMRIHTGQKPFACEVCGKQFNSRDNRNAHRFVHSEKKLYECMDCGAGFMRKPHLMTHMKRSKHSNDTCIINKPQVSDRLYQSASTNEEIFIGPDGEDSLTTDENNELQVIENVVTDDENFEYVDDDNVVIAAVGEESLIKDEWVVEFDLNRQQKIAWTDIDTEKSALNTSE